MKTPLNCQNYINGQWLDAATENTLNSHNPADKSEIVATFPRSQADDVDRAVAAARQAYCTWRKVPAPARAEYIFRVENYYSSTKKN